MVDTILSGAGFVEGETYHETRFIKPPKETYAVYLDDIKRRGSDDQNLITKHSVSIELYEYKPDSAAEEAIELMFDSLGQPYSKEARYWIDEEQLYQVIYNFEYLEK